MALDLKNTEALYVHIPFCDSICSYCDFCKVLSNTYNHYDYLNALKNELSQYPFKQFKTIYIGGGTPSSLSLDELGYLFEFLKPYSLNVLEYSIEVNPESLTLEKVKLFKRYHINRVSIGVQTLNDDTLKFINRHHTSNNVFDCIKMLKEEGITDINVDLIYGLPNNDLNQTLNDIKICDSFNISHISVYSLILEDHTIFKHLNYQPLNDDEDARYYNEIKDYLRKLGYNHYEVSNFYKVKPSLHNLVYWHYEDYLAIGLGAHYKIDHLQIENTRSYEKYINGQYILNKEILSDEDLMFNHLMMSLRLKEGISLDDIHNNHYIDIMNKYMNQGYMKIENNQVSLTYKGLLVMDTLLLEFL